jgi:hypothetical protein
MNRILQGDPDLTGLPPNLVDLVGACLNKTPENRPGLTDLLDRLAASARDATRWLPPQVTEMITQLETTALKQRPETNGAFEMSWTGEEPPSTYADGPSEPPAEYSWILPVILLLVGAAGTLIPWWLDPGIYSAGRHPAVPSISVVLGFTSGGLGLIGALVVFYGNGNRRLEERVTRPYPHRTGWSVYVGPNYIVTTGVTGRREFTWDQIHRVTIEQIKGAGPYRYTGIHLYKEGAGRLSSALPAGWPYPAPRSIKLYKRHFVDGELTLHIPICVLGPMTHEQRTELTQALARFGGRRWQPHGR